MHYSWRLKCYTTFFYTHNLLIIIENTMFSARSELNIYIESFHQRPPYRAMAQAVSARCFTSQKPGFAPRAVHVEFLAVKMAVRQFSLPVLQSPCQYHSTNAPESSPLYYSLSEGRAGDALEPSNKQTVIRGEIDKVLSPRLSIHYKKLRQPARKHRISPFRPASTSHVRGVLI
jgi:hypothetical protein